MNVSRYTHMLHISETETILFNSLFMKGVKVKHPGFTDDEIETYLNVASGDNLRKLMDAHILSTETIDKTVKERALKSISQPRIGTCVIILSEGCNLNCRYCFIENNLTSKVACESMSPQIARRAVEYFSEQMSPDMQPSIVLYGGEPLLNWDSILIVLETVRTLEKENKMPRGCRISINTNGTLITPIVAKTLADHGVTVSISLDGDRIHNYDRIYPDGSESFDDVIRGIEYCREYGVKFGISITATPKLIQQTNGCIEFIRDLNPIKVGINPLLAAGELYPEYGQDLCNMMIRAKDILNKNSVEEDRLTDRISYLESRCIKYHDCSAAKGEQIVITPDGAVGICHEFVGTRDFFISNIWSPAKLTADKRLNQWIQRTPLAMEKCDNCIALGVCGGGCPANAYNIYGDIMELDRNCCGLSRRLVEWYFTEYSVPEESLTLNDPHTD